MIIIKSFNIILCLIIYKCYGWNFGFSDEFNGKKCPYDVLGVSRDSTHKDIRKAFLKLSKQFHPDVNKDEDANDKFKEINDAYDILSNNDKREAYDKYGFEGVERLNRGGFNDDFDNGFDVDDIFSFFGGFNNHHKDFVHKAEPLIYPLNISLDLLYTGHEDEIKLKVPRLCKAYEECEVRRNDCQGFELRVVTQQRGPGMFVQRQMRDPQCIGKLKGWKENCQACPNGPLEMEDITISVNIEPGTYNDQKIVLENKGQEKPGYKRGDIILIVREQKHDTFRREGDDLHCVLDISLRESLLGFSREIDIFGEDTIQVNQSGITPHNNVIRLTGKGMPNSSSGRRGDLHVTINVIYPKKLSNEQIKLIEQALV